MAVDARTLLTRWFDEVWNQRRLETIDELMAPDAVAHGFPRQGASVSGAQFKQAIQSFQQTFSEIHIAIEDMLFDGPKAAVRWRASALHTGDGLGIAPTKEAIEITGISIVEIKDGKIIEGWDAYDLTESIHRLSAIAEQQSQVTKVATDKKSAATKVDLSL